MSKSEGACVERGPERREHRAGHHPERPDDVDRQDVPEHRQRREDRHGVRGVHRVAVQDVRVPERDLPTAYRLADQPVARVERPNQILHDAVVALGERDLERPPQRRAGDNLGRQRHVAQEDRPEARQRQQRVQQPVPRRNGRTRRQPLHPATAGHGRPDPAGRPRQHAVAGRRPDRHGCPRHVATSGTGSTISPSALPCPRRIERPDRLPGQPVMRAVSGATAR